MAAIRSQFTLHGLDTSAFSNERIHLNQKSLYARKFFCESYIITIDMLFQILNFTNTLQFAIIFKALYVFCFFSFLRLSDILPHSMASFDPTRQLCKGYPIFSSDTITVIIKLSKTLQNR